MPVMKTRPRSSTKPATRVLKHDPQCGFVQLGARCRTLFRFMLGLVALDFRRNHTKQSLSSEPPGLAYLALQCLPNFVRSAGSQAPLRLGAAWPQTPPGIKPWIHADLACTFGVPNYRLSELVLRVLLELLRSPRLQHGVQGSSPGLWRLWRRCAFHRTFHTFRASLRAIMCYESGLRDVCYQATITTSRI